MADAHHDTVNGERLELVLALAWVLHDDGAKVLGEVEATKAGVVLVDDSSEAASISVRDVIRALSPVAGRAADGAVGALFVLFSVSVLEEEGREKTEQTDGGGRRRGLVIGIGMVSAGVARESGDGEVRASSVDCGFGCASVRRQKRGRKGKEGDER